MPSRGYELSIGTSLAKVGRDDGKVFYVSKKSEQFDLLFFRRVVTGWLQTICCIYIFICKRLISSFSRMKI